ncbi:MAG: HD-GYP domain-containing protein [Firmicutes bacterium]|nr:HD-GYP domain-containing protein [Bacillota bacterium]
MIEIRIVRVEHLKPGMQLARSVYSADGRVLLSAGIVIKESYIERLRRMGFPAVYVGDPEEAGAFKEAVRESTRRRAIAVVQGCFDEVKFGSCLNIAPIAQVVNNIVDEVVSNREIILPLADIRKHDDYTFGHSVNVCIISTMLGVALELNDLALRELAMGAILHDVGKVKVPEEILLKPAALTPEEWAEMKKHTLYGFELLRGGEEVSSRTAHVSYQHHERCNGSGYPRALRGEEIHLFAKIAAVADTYDAMTSDRVYREGVTPYETLKVIKELAAEECGELDKDVVDVFLANVMPYPPGCKVRLTTGEVGMVVGKAQHARDSVMVEVSYDAKGLPLGQPTLVEVLNMRLAQIV